MWKHRPASLAAPISGRLLQGAAREPAPRSNPDFIVSGAGCVRNRRFVRISRNAWRQSSCNSVSQLVGDHRRRRGRYEHRIDGRKSRFAPYQIRISDLDNVLLRKDLPEAGPARPRIEFRRRAEQRGITAHASEESRGVEIPTIPGIGTLRTRLSSDLI
jgi:hypothetical protein